MTVAELLDALKRFPADAEVRLLDSATDWLIEISPADVGLRPNGIVVIGHDDNGRIAPEPDPS